MTTKWTKYGTRLQKSRVYIFFFFKEIQIGIKTFQSPKIQNAFYYYHFDLKWYQTFFFFDVISSMMIVIISLELSHM